MLDVIDTNTSTCTLVSDKKQWERMQEWMIACFPDEADGIWELAPHQITDYINENFDIRSQGIQAWFKGVRGTEPLCIHGAWYIYNYDTKLFYTGETWVLNWYVALHFSNHVEAYCAIPDEF
jgi:hypothetical protein